MDKMPSTSVSNEEFENIFEVTIHEMFHVFGVSGSALNYWINPSNPSAFSGKPNISGSKTIRGKTTSYLTTPNLVNLAKTHYNCPSISIFPFENDGGSGTLGSHPETTAIGNDIMVGAASPTTGVYSKFTLAILADTNWYAELDTSFTERL